MLEFTMRTAINVLHSRNIKPNLVRIKVKHVSEYQTKLHRSRVKINYILPQASSARGVNCLMILSSVEMSDNFNFFYY